MPDLRSIATDLYGRPLADFVTARKQAAADVGDKALAKQVLALRKPSAAAWAVNALARERAELVEEVLDLGEELRDAQADSDGTRTRLLDRARRDLTRQALDEARELVEESGGSLSAQAETGVEETLRAAMTDPEAGSAVQEGLLVSAFSATPFEPVDLSDVLAIPPEGSRPRRSKPARRAGPTQLERKRREAAQAKLAKAHRRATAAAKDLEARAEEREELAAELTEQRKELKALERRIRETEAALDKTDKAVDRAEDADQDAQAELSAAQADLDRLG